MGNCHSFLKVDGKPYEPPPDPTNRLNQIYVSESDRFNTNGYARVMTVREQIAREAVYCDDGTVRITPVYQDNHDHDNHRDNDQTRIAEAIELLTEHEYLLLKLEQLNPGSKKSMRKINDIKLRLIEIEEILDRMIADGVKLPHDYRKSTRWSRFKRATRKFGRKIADFFKRNEDTILLIMTTMASVITAIIAIVVKTK